MDELTATILATMVLQDSVTGRYLHPLADRGLTVLEARRAQGYPEYEIVLGPASEQWRVVENSVARGVALALGMCLRAAWLENHGRSREAPEPDQVSPNEKQSFSEPSQTTKSLEVIGADSTDRTSEVVELDIAVRRRKSSRSRVTAEEATKKLEHKRTSRKRYRSMRSRESSPNKKPNFRIDLPPPLPPDQDDSYMDHNENLVKSS